MSKTRRQVWSKNSLFKGELVDMPLRAKGGVHLPGDEYEFTCPHCSSRVKESQCDVVGAEPGAVFCVCNREVYI